RMSNFYMTSDGSSWKEIASLPDSVLKRDDAVAFAANGKGYFGLGAGVINEGTSVEDVVELNDFYEYTPETNTWVQIDSFPGLARKEAVAFGIGDKGYVGGGYTISGYNTSTFYEYDAVTGVWAVKAPLTTSNHISNAASFVINGEGYVVGGSDENSNLNSQLIKYNPTTDKWTELNRVINYTSESFDNDYSIQRYKAATFVINEKAYLVGGTTKTSVSDQVWEYDPSLDEWEELQGYEGNMRYGAVGFSIGNYGYVGTGTNGTYYFNDFWKFDPTADYDKLW
ncbi:galactose oxidase, partial [bacterium]|nr:galactose oxidase [bacterium]